MNLSKGLKIALIGTESFRGKEMKNILEGKNYPLKEIEFFDPDVEQEYSKLTEFRGEARIVLPLDENAIADSDLVFLAADKDTNVTYGKLAMKKKFLAIDLNETFNQDEDIPVVVAGVNHANILKNKPSLIANPHPATVVLSHILHGINKEYQPKELSAIVLQPASAFGDEGIQELANQSFSVLNSSSVAKKTFKTQVAFNLISDIDSVDKQGFSSTEKQILSETRRVLDLETLPLSVVVVQAPVFHTYAVMIHLGLKERIGIPKLTESFKKSPFFKVLTSSPSRPASCSQIAGKEEIFIGQIKKDTGLPDRFWIWAVMDNLIRGSALNAYEIMENSLSLNSIK
jgi:aspartate-semialdehyde dehydrogenase